MNVKSMTTNQLLNQWTKTDRGEDRPIIDELHRRCKAGGFEKFVDPESLIVFYFFTDRHGELRMLGEPKVAVFDDLDKYIHRAMSDRYRCTGGAGQMNVRTIDTLQLCQSWINDPCDLIWDELLRRTRGELVAAPKGLVYEIALVDGFKLVRLIRPRNPADLDHQFLETSPRATDSLAFEPSDELDAATLAQ